MPPGIWFHYVACVQITAPPPLAETSPAIMIGWLVLYDMRSIDGIGLSLT